MKKIYILILLYSFICCKSKDTPHKDLSHLIAIPINTEQVEDTNFESTYLPDRFIQLETTDSTALSSLSKVLVTEDSIIMILDEKQQSIFLFSLEGEFLNVIRKLGGGPEEYRNIKDFTYDKSENSIVVLDIGTQSLIYYTVPDCKFRIRKRIEQRQVLGYRIDYFSNKYIFNRMNYESKEFNGQLAISNTGDLAVLTSGMPQCEPLLNTATSIPHPLDVVDSTFYSLDFLNDTIYTYSESKILPAYYFKYDLSTANTVAKELMNGANRYGDNYIEKLFSDAGIWSFSNLFSTSDYFYFNFSYKNKGVVNIFNKKTLKTYAITAFPTYRDKYYINPPVARFKDYFISQAIEKEISNTSLVQNPLLCLYSINSSKLP